MKAGSRDSFPLDGVRAARFLQSLRDFASPLPEVAVENEGERRAARLETGCAIVAHSFAQRFAEWTEGARPLRVMVSLGEGGGEACFLPVIAFWARRWPIEVSLVYVLRGLEGASRERSEVRRRGLARVCHSLARPWQEMLDASLRVRMSGHLRSPEELLLSSAEEEDIDLLLAAGGAAERLTTCLQGGARAVYGLLEE